MNILLITKLWTGLVPFFTKKENRAYGMPAFFNTLNMLLSDDTIEKIYIILFVKSSKKQRKTLKKQIPNVPTCYEHKLKIYQFHYNRYREIILKFPLALFLALWIVTTKKIKLVYGHGTVGALAGLVSILTGVKNIRRMYGVSYLMKYIDKPKKMKFKEPLDYLTLTLPAEMLIITNDGSKGDALFSVLNKNKNKIKEFHFLINPVDKNIQKKIKKPAINIDENSQYISYISRIERDKGQDKLIETLIILKEKGIKIKTYIIGQISDEPFYNELINKINKHSLNEYVHIITGLPWEETMYILAHSTITCVFYKTTNLSNVFLEALSLGVPIIAINTYNSLDIIPDDVFYKLPETAHQEPKIIADALQELLDNEQKRKTISIKAKTFAMQTLQTWQERAKLEKQWIHKTANQMTKGKFFGKSR